MKPSENGLTLIQVFEQLRLSPYLDSAHIWTVGWGHALTTPAGQAIDADVFGTAKAHQLMIEAMQRIFGAQTITREQADTALAADMASHATAISRMIAGDTTQAQFDALLSFGFNVGEGNFASSSVKRLHNAGDRAIGEISIHDLAAKSQAHASPNTMPLAFVAWSNSNHQWSLGLFRRRVAELLVYSGWDAQKAFDLVEQYNG